MVQIVSWHFSFDDVFLLRKTAVLFTFVITEHFIPHMTIFSSPPSGVSLEKQMVQGYIPHFQAEERK